MKGLSGFHRAAVALAFAVGLGFAGGPAAAQSTFTLLHSFCVDGTCSDGQFPTGTLVADGSHNIFGTTKAGGEHGGGVVFELVYIPNTATYRYKRLYNFCTVVVGCTDGAQPTGDRLIVDVNGTLYGTTYAGGPSGSGVVFKLVPNAGHTRYTYSVIYQFCVQFSGCEDGAQPSGALTFAGEATGGTYDGKAALYGSTLGGGRKHQGVVFSLVPPATQGDMGTHKVLYFFCTIGRNACNDGSQPAGGMVVDKNGNIWGTTISGGLNDSGVIFKLTPTVQGPWAESLPYQFCSVAGCADGMTPMNGLIADSNGDLYGTTATGGLPYKKCAATGCGVVFKITTGNKESTIYSFCSQTDCTDGGAVQGLSVDPNDNFYGVASVGGPKNHGLVFKLTGTSLTDLLDLQCRTLCSMGQNPSGALMINANLDLFGLMTDAGRHGDAGTAFKVSQP
ncbi:MAG: hypothetical protein JO261_02545 [Alphaproteobacteria bacterium]|nr:hypothetical protein [Alphaproteobacteria bacterium]MBV9692557.1 hypothetical protein [Alphaproteobacteria bacterium]